MSRVTPQHSRSGGPLRALAGLLLCWIAVRFALFEMPFDRPRIPELVPAIARLASSEADTSEAPPPSRVGAGTPEFAQPPAFLTPRAALDSRVEPFVLAPPLLPPPLPEPQVARRTAAAHNLLWMAAMQGMPLLPAVEAAIAGGGAATAGAAAARTATRWSGDGWLVWREGGRGIAAGGALTPVYGGSQAGAVLRYALAPGSKRRPVAYLRAVQALDVVREGDVAAGLALRPLPDLPVTMHAEARLARRGDRLSVNPAAFASAGVDRLPVEGGVALRGYVQAGYVGGPEATGFVDGSLVAEKPLWTDRDRALTTGAGAWGGVQRGAGRLDLGPTASLRFRLGEGTARLSADYRLRVAGEAAPARGAAVTLATGF